MIILTRSGSLRSNPSGRRTGSGSGESSSGRPNSHLSACQTASALSTWHGRDAIVAGNVLEQAAGTGGLQPEATVDFVARLVEPL